MYTRRIDGAPHTRFPGFGAVSLRIQTSLPRVLLCQRPGSVLDPLKCTLGEIVTCISIVSVYSLTRYRVE